MVQLMCCSIGSEAGALEWIYQSKQGTRTVRRVSMRKKKISVVGVGESNKMACIDVVGQISSSRGSSLLPWGRI